MPLRIGRGAWLCVNHPTGQPLCLISPGLLVCECVCVLTPKTPSRSSGFLLLDFPGQTRHWGGFSPAQFPILNHFDHFAGVSRV